VVDGRDGEAAGDGGRVMGGAAHIIGVPLDHGAGRRGVGMGPSAMRIAKLHDTLRRVGWKVRDRGDLHIVAPEAEEQANPGPAHARFLPTVAGACEELAAMVAGVMRDGGFPLVIGGDHSIAIGTISGLAVHARALADAASVVPVSGPASNLGVIWFDAHGDINTPESSPSGNIHGMPVSCLLGKGPPQLVNIGFPGAKLSPKRVAQIGLRDIDEQEKRLIWESGIHTYTMADIDQRGMSAVVAEAIEFVSDGTDLLHVSFDIDSVDPRVAPGTGTPNLGGLTYREAHLGLEMIAASKRLTSFEMVEVNPILDTYNQTSEVAVGLIASAMGKRIL
jgi:arginase